MSVNVDNFGESFQNGHRVELELLATLKRKYKTAVLMEGNFPFYDIDIPEVQEQIEVKRDYKSAETGNFFFETYLQAKGDEQRHPTGVNVTRCSWWVHVDQEYYYYIRFENLDYIIREGILNGTVKEIKTIGDDGTTVWGYIIPKRHFEVSPYVEVKLRPKLTT